VQRASLAQPCSVTHGRGTIQGTALLMADAFEASYHNKSWN